MLAQPYGANVATMAADHVISENGDAGVTGMPNPRSVLDIRKEDHH